MEAIKKTIIAKLYPSGFAKSDANYNSLNVLGGDVYYTLSCHKIDTHARIYKYNIAKDEISLFADLGEVTGEAGKKSIPQGKSHSPIYEIGDRIYFATHYGFYQGNNGKEEPAPPPEGYTAYPGGKLIEYSKSTGKFRILFAAPPQEGIITMNIDIKRMVAYCITWPSGIFMYYDLNAEELHIVGQKSRGGEMGVGENYFCLCRAFAIDPRDGTVYFTNADGEILEYHAGDDDVKSVAWASMRKDVFGMLDPHQGGHQGYNWRYIIWNEKYQKFYGVHGLSGYLFSFDPKEKKLEVIDRIAGEYCRKNGTYEVFRYGYMTLALRPGDDDTLYYISGYYKFENPDEVQTRMMQQAGSPGDDVVAKAKSFISLVTYHLPTGTYRDHGVIRLEDGRYPNNTQTIGITPDGRIFTCPWIEKTDPAAKPGETNCELISIRLP